MLNMELPFAEDVPYWKTGQSSPDTWIEKAKRTITQFGGELLAEGFGCEHGAARSAFLLAFRLDGEEFRITWPVLPTRHGSELSARRQAATMLYHDIKARCLSARVLGARMAFFAWLRLPDGRVAGQLALPELQSVLPAMLTAPTGGSVSAGIDAEVVKT